MRQIKWTLPTTLSAKEQRGSSFSAFFNERSPHRCVLFDEIDTNTCHCDDMNFGMPCDLFVNVCITSVLPLHRYRRGQGSDPGKPDFFRLSFRNCISCVNDCEDLLYICFFIPQFKYMNFIYSQFRLYFVGGSGGFD